MAKPKLALIPAAYGSKFYSILPSNGVGDFDFSRSSVATRINPEGLIESVTSGQSRLDYPLVNGVQKGCPHYLLEPSRTNYIPYSTLDFDGGVKPNGWSIGFGIGSYSYEQLTYKGQKAVKQTQITTGRSYLDTGSITILANTEHTLKIQFILNECVADANDNILSFINFGAFAIYKFSDIDSNGVLEIQFNPLSDNVGSLRIGLGVDQNATGSKSLAWVIPQLEQGSYATSYIPTNGTAVTRVGETANGSGDASTFNDSEGVLMAEISALSDDLTNRRITISDNSTSNRIVLGFADASNTILALVGSSGTQFISTIAISDTKVNNKLALKYKQNNFALWINGFEAATDTSGNTPNGLSALKIQGSTGFSNFYGKTKQLQYFDSALADTQLEQLTSWLSFRDMAEAQSYIIQ